MLHWPAHIPSILVIVVLIIAAGCGGTRETSPREDAAAADTRSNATIAIQAEVEIESLRHRTEPEASVRFTGNARDTLRRTVRVNLPEDVEPGVEYRNVRIHYELYTGFDTTRVYDRLRDALNLPLPDTTR